MSADHDEGEGGRGQARAPVVHAEVLKEKHGAPVVERGLLQPGMAVEIRRDAGAQPALERVRRVEAHQHLVRDLGIARLVGAHQAQAVAAQQRRKPVSKEKDGEGEKDRRFARSWPSEACAIADVRVDPEPMVPRDFPSPAVLQAACASLLQRRTRVLVPGRTDGGSDQACIPSAPAEARKHGDVSTGTRLTDSRGISRALCSPEIDASPEACRMARQSC